ncbi:riboflavin kinase / FMN adenylyltransferase [Lachnospiraceae bacterium NE2001]|nr:riboflavin kinase / FMN adenylyltransferase [Lachnospiraceae bacterium NE2001]
MKKTALTIGKFNGFHLGHQMLLKDIAEVAEREGMTPRILKLVTSDSGIFDSAEIAQFLENEFPSIKDIEYITFTPEFAKMSPEEFVSRILVDEMNVGYVSVGVDFRFGKDRAGDVKTLRELGEKYGFRLNVIDKLRIDENIVSSSLIREKLADGDMKSAEKYLGRPYSIMGKVESGKKLGRSLGYPTVNIALDETKILPRYGVYSSVVRIFDGKEWHNYSGITNIGMRPSIDDGDKATVETFIYDFNDDIYGFDVIIVPEVFIRDERHFTGLEELTQQIAKDIEMAASLA